MITNRHQKKQSNISCIPDGNVHAFHHKIFYLALKEFEREGFFSGKCAFFQRSLSQSLIVCCAVNNTLTFFGVLSCLVSLRPHKSLSSLRSLRSPGFHRSLG